MIDIDVDENDIPDKLKKMASRLEDPEDILRDLGGHWQRRVTNMMPDHGPRNPEPAKKGKPPAVHTSEYVHSIMYEPDGEQVHLGSSSIRARILQEGGTIRARSGMLAVPISAESYGRRPRDFSGLSIGPRFRSQGMMKMLLGRGTGEDFEPLFVLQPKVTINPHPHLEFTKDDRIYLQEAVEDALDEDLT